MQGKNVKRGGWGARLWMEYSISWLTHLHKVRQRMYPIWSQGRRQVVPMSWFNFPGIRILLIPEADQQGEIDGG